MKCVVFVVAVLLALHAAAQRTAQDNASLLEEESALPFYAQPDDDSVFVETSTGMYAQAQSQTTARWSFGETWQKLRTTIEHAIACKDKFKIDGSVLTVTDQSWTCVASALGIYKHLDVNYERPKNRKVTATLDWSKIAKKDVKLTVTIEVLVEPATSGRIRQLLVAKAKKESAMRKLVGLLGWERAGAVLKLTLEFDASTGMPKTQTFRTEVTIVGNPKPKASGISLPATQTQLEYRLPAGDDAEKAAFNVAIFSTASFVAKHLSPNPMNIRVAGKYYHTTGRIVVASLSDVEGFHLRHQDAFKLKDTAMNWRLAIDYTPKSKTSPAGYRALVCGYVRAGKVTVPSLPTAVTFSELELQATEVPKAMEELLDMEHCVIPAKVLQSGGKPLFRIVGVATNLPDTECFMAVATTDFDRQTPPPTLSDDEAKAVEAISPVMAQMLRDKSLIKSLKSHFAVSFSTCPGGIRVPKIKLGTPLRHSGAASSSSGGHSGGASSSPIPLLSSSPIPLSSSPSLASSASPLPTNDKDKGKEEVVKAKDVPTPLSAVADEVASADPTPERLAELEPEAETTIEHGITFFVKFEMGDGLALIRSSVPSALHFTLTARVDHSSKEPHYTFKADIEAKAENSVQFVANKFFSHGWMREILARHVFKHDIKDSIRINLHLDGSGEHPTLDTVAGKLEVYGEANVQTGSDHPAISAIITAGETFHWVSRQKTGVLQTRAAFIIPFAKGLQKPEDGHEEKSEFRLYFTAWKEGLDKHSALANGNIVRFGGGQMYGAVSSSFHPDNWVATVGGALTVLLWKTQIDFDAAGQVNSEGNYYVVSHAGSYWPGAFGFRGLGAHIQVLYQVLKKGKVANSLHQYAETKTNLIFCGSLVLNDVGADSTAFTLPANEDTVFLKSAMSPKACVLGGKHGSGAVDVPKAVPLFRIGGLVRNLGTQLPTCYVGAVTVDADGVKAVLDRMEANKIKWALFEWVYIEQLTFAYSTCSAFAATELDGLVAPLADWGRKINQGVNLFAVVKLGPRMKRIDDTLTRIQAVMSPAAPNVDSSLHLSAVIPVPPTKIQINLISNMGIKFCRAPCDPKQNYILEFLGLQFGIETGFDGDVALKFNIGARVTLSIPRKPTKSDMLPASLAASSSGTSSSKPVEPEVKPDKLIFYGEGKFEISGASNGLSGGFAAGMLTAEGWHIFPFLTVHQVGLKMTFSPAAAAAQYGVPIETVGAFGKLEFCGVMLDVKASVSVVTPKNFAFEARLANLDFGKLVRWLIAKMKQAAREIKHVADVLRILVRHNDRDDDALFVGSLEPTEKDMMLLAKRVAPICVAHYANSKRATTSPSSTSPSPVLKRSSSLPLIPISGSGSGSGGSPSSNALPLLTRRNSSPDLEIEECGKPDEAATSPQLNACFTIVDEAARRQCYTKRYPKDPKDVENKSAEDLWAHMTPIQRERWVMRQLSIESVVVRFAPLDAVDLGGGVGISKGIEISGAVRISALSFAASLRMTTLWTGMVADFMITNHAYQTADDAIHGAPPPNFTPCTSANEYLMGTELVRLKGLSRQECAEVCLVYPQCLGFNYGFSGFAFEKCVIVGGARESMMAQDSRANWVCYRTANMVTRGISTVEYPKRPLAGPELCNYLNVVKDLPNVYEVKLGDGVAQPGLFYVRRSLGQRWVYTRDPKDKAYWRICHRGAKPEPVRKVKWPVLNAKEWDFCGALYDAEVAGLRVVDKDTYTKLSKASVDAGPSSVADDEEVVQPEVAVVPEDEPPSVLGAEHERARERYKELDLKVAPSLVQAEQLVNEDIVTKQSKDVTLREHLHEISRHLRFLDIFARTANDYDRSTKEIKAYKTRYRTALDPDTYKQLKRYNALVDDALIARAEAATAKEGLQSEVFTVAVLSAKDVPGAEDTAHLFCRVSVVLHPKAKSSMGGQVRRTTRFVPPHLLQSYAGKPDSAGIYHEWDRILHFDAEPRVRIADWLHDGFMEVWVESMDATVATPLHEVDHSMRVNMRCRIPIQPAWLVDDDNIATHYVEISAKTIKQMPGAYCESFHNARVPILVKGPNSVPSIERSTLPKDTILRFSLRVLPPRFVADGVPRFQLNRIGFEGLPLPVPTEEVRAVISIRLFDHVVDHKFALNPKEILIAGVKAILAHAPWGEILAHMKALCVTVAEKVKVFFANIKSKLTKIWEGFVNLFHRHKDPDGPQQHGDDDKALQTLAICNSECEAATSRSVYDKDGDLPARRERITVTVMESSSSSSSGGGKDPLAGDVPDVTPVGRLQDDGSLSKRLTSRIDFEGPTDIVQSGLGSKTLVSHPLDLSGSKPITSSLGDAASSSGDKADTSLHKSSSAPSLSPQKAPSQAHRAQAIGRGIVPKPRPPVTDAHFIPPQPSPQSHLPSGSSPSSSSKHKTTPTDKSGDESK